MVSAVDLLNLLIAASRFWKFALATKLLGAAWPGGPGSPLRPGGPAGPARPVGPVGPAGPTDPAEPLHAAAATAITSSKRICIIPPYIRHVSECAVASGDE